MKIWDSVGGGAEGGKLISQDHQKTQDIPISIFRIDIKILIIYIKY